MFQLLTIFLLLSSCSSLTKEGPEDKEDSYSKPAVLQLVNTTYTKGCIDGVNLKNPKKTYGVNFKKCRDLAIEHTEKIKNILK
jgi:hypothetical protein